MVAGGQSALQRQIERSGGILRKMIRAESEIEKKRAAASRA